MNGYITAILCEEVVEQESYKELIEEVLYDINSEIRYVKGNTLMTIREYVELLFRYYLTDYINDYMYLETTFADYAFERWYQELHQDIYFLT